MSQNISKLWIQVIRKRLQERPQPRPCKATVVHALKEHDPGIRIHFGNWFLQSVYDGEVHQQLVLFSNEVWYFLRGEVNSKNSRYKSAEHLTVLSQESDVSSICRSNGDFLKFLSQRMFLSLPSPTVKHPGNRRMM